MNRYQKALDFLNTRCNCAKRKNYFIRKEAVATLQELIDNYSKLEKSLDYLLNYLDKKYLLDDEKSFSRYLYRELLEEDIRRMLESEKQ